MTSSKGDTHKAIEDFGQAIRHDPKDAGALRQRAALRQAKGDNELAVADLTQALALEPKNAQAYYQRALAYERSKNSSNAADDFKSALTLDAKLGEARKALARLGPEIRNKAKSAVRSEPVEKIAAKPEATVKDGDDKPTGQIKIDAAKAPAKDAVKDAAKPPKIEIRDRTKKTAQKPEIRKGDHRRIPERRPQKRDVKQHDVRRDNGRVVRPRYVDERGRPIAEPPRYRPTRFSDVFR